jgi:hypothetical protein
MPGHRYGIYESVGSTREPVTDYDDLSNHHPSKNFQEPNRRYEEVNGRKEEVVSQDGRTMVSKDFVLYDPTGIRRLTDVTDADKRVPVPSPFAGVVEVNQDKSLMIIRDPVTNEPLARIRHMSGITLQTGDTVEYGQALGTQSNHRTAHVHTHMDVNTRYITQFDQYLKDLSSGALTTEGYLPDQASNDAQRFIEQTGTRLTEMGFDGRQIETLATVAAAERARFGAQGEASQFLLSRDGNTIAMRQEHPPLREFSVAAALENREQPQAGMGTADLAERQRPGASLSAAPPDHIGRAMA